MKKRPTSNAPTRTQFREICPIVRPETAVDRVILSMNEKLKHLETRYRDLVTQCQGFRKLESGSQSKDASVSDDSQELSALRSLDQEKDQLDTELQLLLRTKKTFASEIGEPKDVRSSKAIYDSISETLHAVQSRFLRLFHSSLSEHQAKTQAAELFMELSDTLWSLIYKLRTNGDSRDMKQLVNEVMRIEQAKQVIDLRIAEAQEALRQKYAGQLLKAKQKVAVLRAENRRFEAQFQTISKKFSASLCNSPVGLKKGPFSIAFLEENQNLRSTAPSLSPGAYTRSRTDLGASMRPAKSERTSLSPLWTRRPAIKEEKEEASEEYFKDQRLDEIRKEVEHLRMQLSASQQDRKRPPLDSPRIGELDYKKKLAVLTSEAKEYLKATKDMVRKSGLQQAEDPLKSLTRTINDVLRDGPFSEWRRSFQKPQDWSGKYALEQTNKMLESENKRLEEALSLEKSRADRLIEMVEAFQKDIQPKSQEIVVKLTKEVRQLTDRKQELELQLEDEKAFRSKTKKEHDSVVSDLVNDCQELTEELKLLRRSKAQLATVSQQRDTELKGKLSDMERVYRENLSRLVEEASNTLQRSFRQLEDRVRDLDTRLIHAKSFISSQLTETLQRLTSISPLPQDSVDVESILSVEREKMEYTLQQNQDWTDTRLEDLRRELESTEEKRAALAFDLLHEKEINSKLTLKLESLRDLEPKANAAQSLSEQLEESKSYIEAAHGRIKLLLVETDQLRYEKSELEEQIARLLASTQALQGDTRQLREELQLLAAKQDAKADEVIEEVTHKSEQLHEVELGSASMDTGEMDQVRGELAEAQATCRHLQQTLEEKDNQLKANMNLHAAELIELRTELEENIRSLQSKCGDLVDELEKMQNYSPEPSPRESPDKYSIRLFQVDDTGEKQIPADLSSERSLRDSELQRSKEELIDASRKNESLEKEIARLQSNNVKMKGDRMHFETELSRVKSLPTLVDMLRTENNELQSQVKVLKEENQRLFITSQISDPQVATAIEDYEARIENYKEQLRERNTMYDSLEAKISDLEQQLDRDKDLFSSKVKIMTVSLDEMTEKRRIADEQSAKKLSEVIDLKGQLAHSEELLQIRTQAYTRITEDLGSIAKEAGLGEGSNDTILAAIREALSQRKPIEIPTDISNSPHAKPPQCDEKSPVSVKSCTDATCSNKKKYENLVAKYQDVFKDWKEALEHSQQHKAALESERKAAKLNIESERVETQKLKRNFEKLEEDYIAMKQKHSQEIVHIREEFAQQMADKDQHIAILEANARYTEENREELQQESPIFSLNPEEGGRIEIHSEGSREEGSFQEQVQDFIDLTPGTGSVVRVVEYDNIVWQLIFTYAKDYHWRRADGEPVSYSKDLELVHDLLQSVMPPFTSVPEAVQQLILEVKTLRRASPGFRKLEYSPDLEKQVAQINRDLHSPSGEEANSFEQGEGELGMPTPHSFGLSSREMDLDSGRSEMHKYMLAVHELREENKALRGALTSEQGDNKRLEEMMHVLRDELRAKGEKNKQQGESIMPHVRTAVIALIVELPKLSQKGEAMLKTIYSHFELTAKQIDVLERARKGKKQDKAGAVTQVLS